MITAYLGSGVGTAVACGMAVHQGVGGIVGVSVGTGVGVGAEVGAGVGIGVGVGTSVGVGTGVGITEGVGKDVGLAGIISGVVLTGVIGAGATVFAGVADSVAPLAISSLKVGKFVDEGSGTRDRSTVAVASGPNEEFTVGFESGVRWGLSPGSVGGTADTVGLDAGTPGDSCSTLFAEQPMTRTIITSAVYSRGNLRINRKLTTDLTICGHQFQVSKARVNWGQFRTSPWSIIPINGVRSCFFISYATHSLFTNSTPPIRLLSTSIQSCRSSTHHASIKYIKSPAITKLSPTCHPTSLSKAEPVATS